MIKLLGNTVLVEPMGPEGQVAKSGLLLPNRYGHHVMLYQVKAVGEGAWRRRRRKAPVLEKPEVKPGDIIITRAANQAHSVKEHFDCAGIGPMIIRASSVEAVIEGLPYAALA